MNCGADERLFLGRPEKRGNLGRVEWTGIAAIDWSGL